MKTKIIQQEISFNTTPDILYELLMNEKKHAEFTGAEAKITNKEGGKFTVWGNYITGKNLILEKNKKIVQEWYCSDLPQSHLCMVTFLFTPVINKNGKIVSTTLNFLQTNVPVAQWEELNKGWMDYYWIPIIRYLKNIKSL